MSKPISRRGFLKQLNCAAVGTSAILNTLLNLKLANTVAAQGGPLDNKALVCLFMSGGCDSFNVLVPWEQSAYNTYSVTRGAFGSDGGLALVMQLVPGRTLKQAVMDDGPFDPDRAERVLRDVAEALAFAHSKGVVHRDVKPENIFMEAGTGRALLSDFGIAHSTEFDSRLTMTGAAIGTPAYMAPEQIDGAPANARSDIYAMGGEPLTALCIVGFPVGKLPIEVLSDILRGGPDKVHEAGASIAGGHSILDDEVKFGLAVSEMVGFQGTHGEFYAQDEDDHRGDPHG